MASRTYPSIYPASLSDRSSFEKGQHMTSFPFSLIPRAIRRRASRFSTVTETKSTSLGDCRSCEDDVRHNSINAEILSAYKDTRASASSEMIALSPPPSRSSSSGSSTNVDTEDSTLNEVSLYRRDTTVTLPDSSGGVGWKYANEGCMLLSRAIREASTPSQDQELTRALYVDGIAYLLHGLPSDLRPDEVARLNSAMPSGVDLIENQPSQQAIESTPHNEVETSADLSKANRAPLLQRTIAFLTMQIVLLIGFLLPFVDMLIRQAYRYEYKYNISGRILASGMTVADGFWKRVVRLANSIYAMNQGKVGEAIREVYFWWMSALALGLYDGLGEGLEIVRSRAGTNQSEKEEKVPS